MDPGETGKSTSRARGRIAEVLAQARASLSEPSRPFTPSSLDQRTSLSTNFKALDKHGRIALSRASANGKLSRNAEASRTRSYQELDVSRDRDRESSSSSRGPAEGNNDTDDNEQNVPERRRSVQSTSRAATSTSSSRSTSSDVLDSVRTLRSLLSSSDNVDTETLQLFNVRSLKEIVISAFEPVEKIAKFLKSDEANDLNVIREILAVIEEFFYFLSEDDKMDSENGNKNENEFTRKLACRLIVRLSVSILSRNVFLNTVAVSSSSLKRDFIPVTFLQTIRSMFRHLKAETELKNKLPGNTSIFIENKIPQQHQDFMKEKEKEKKEKVLLSYGTLSDPLRDFIFQHSIDLLLGFQTTFCILMPNLGLRLIHFKNEICENNDNGGSSNNGISFRNDEKSCLEKEREILELLEIAVFTAGILRHHSSDEVNRRKLSHLQSIENLSELLRSMGSFTVSCQKEITFNIEKNRKKMISKTNGIAIDALLNKFIEKMSQIVVQLVVVIRNYSLDVSGRSQLQNTKIVSLLCSLLKPFKAFPELSLNCVRVTAKLTLQDSFRNQINSKPSHIKCLIEVLVLQGGCCENIMNGQAPEGQGAHQFLENSGDDNYNNKSHSNNGSNGGSNSGSSSSSGKEGRRSQLTVETEEEGEGEGAWPFWYTWPLISRVAFTLGNLTTSNNVNRVLIGLDSEALSPILSLLQACAGSLNQLYCESVGSRGEGRSSDSEEKEEDSEEEEDEDEYSRGAIGQELSDATVKLLRLLANLAIEERIGSRLAGMPETLQMLIELTSCCSRVSTAAGTEERTGDEEELLLNTVAACTNVTFYACRGLSEEAVSYVNEKIINSIMGENDPSRSLPPSPMRNKTERQLVVLSGHLADCLFHENEEVVLESARALGNLTRNRDVSRSLIVARIDEALLLLLAHSHPDIVAAVSGVLVNVSGDPEWKATYRTEKGYKKASPFPPLLGVLRRSSLKDLLLSTLICQILHNLLHSDGTHTPRPLLHSAPPLLTATLEELAECSREMAEEYSAERQSRNKGFESVFSIPGVTEGGEAEKAVRRYSDFSSVARAVIAQLARLETSYIIFNTREIS